MDFCLRGSQINLAERQKPKPKYSSQLNLYNLHSHSRIRPHSAQFFQKRSRSSPFLVCRPQSADPRSGGRRQCYSSCSHYNCNENNFVGGKFNNKNIQKQTVSSSNLLKLLLDEPIKRSWLCRGSPSGLSSPDDNHSVLSTSRKSSSYSNLNKRTRTESIGGNSSAEGDTSCGNFHKSLGGKYNTGITSAARMASSSSNLSKENSSYEYWSSSANVMSTMPTTASANFTHKIAKPDLPGRVSFSKPNMQTNIDYSDCDNDKQEPYHDTISMPGPMTFSYGNTMETTSNNNNPTTVNTGDISSTSAGLKKSVHFGSTSGGEGILAETFEYPKCPSENCSCSTRSSSTASIHDTAEVKCACDSSTCKYTLDTRRNSLNLELDKLKMEQHPSTSKDDAASATIEDSAVIREYKNAVGEKLENSIVKNILQEDAKTKASSCYTNLNNMELSTTMPYSAALKADTFFEKQNNLSDSKSLGQFKSAVTKSDLIKTENNLGLPVSVVADPEIYAVSTSEAVINNYLHVTGNASIITKKKENNSNQHKASIGEFNPNTSTMKKLKSSSATQSQSKMKCSPTTADERSSSVKLKKVPTTPSFGSLREDSNLTEFNLDKVDSWMSIHEQTLGRKSTNKHDATDDAERFVKLSKEAIDAMLEAEEAEDERQEADSSASQISTKSDDQSQDDSTYDEIVSVIKEIEEDKKKDNLAENRTTTEFNLKLDDTNADTVAETLQPTSHDERSEAPKPPEDKYKDILTYLDNVEDSCDKTLLETRRSIPESNRSEVEFIVEPDIAEDVPKLSDLLMLPNHQLARRVVALSLRANELANAVYLSKEYVMKIRNEKQKSLRAEKANAAGRMRDQKKHYEDIVKRHQGFIEQLLKDKGSLCEKVAALTRRLESQNQAWEHKLEAEIQRVKENTLAGEKIRRERWVRENTKKIKELTVKGLEAEINKMTCEHQQEVTELKRAHQQQLLDALEDARIRHEQIENSIRESLAQDREAIIEKERTAIRERFERQLQEERKSFDDQKQKICEEFAMERERMQNELRAKDSEHHTRRLEMQREKEIEMEQAIAELHEKMSKQEEKYQNRINTIEKQYEADFEIWKKDYDSSCKITQAEKENAIRQHYRTERDHQIDAIVCRMDAEAQKNAEEYEMKLTRLREKYEKDIQDAENVEKAVREKYANTRSKLAESDAQVRNYQAEIKQLQIELGHSKKMCNEFLLERDQLRENLRNEIQSEVTNIKNERDQEIQRIHKRVQQAIEKKDATIDILQKENGSIRERCLKLEAVIRQQRKDYCVK